MKYSVGDWYIFYFIIVGVKSVTEVNKCCSVHLLPFSLINRVDREECRKWLKGNDKERMPIIELDIIQLHLQMRRRGSLNGGGGNDVDKFI